MVIKMQRKYLRDYSAWHGKYYYDPICCSKIIANIRGCVKDDGVLGSVRFKDEVDSAIAQRVGLGR